MYIHVYIVHVHQLICVPIYMCGCMTFTADEYMTMKQVAAVRFHRNHRLMMEVFSDVCIPDPRTGEQHAALHIHTYTLHLRHVYIPFYMI